ncbi:MAG: hypothetical protein QM528_04870 [Phycisphaerales bacterium]|nr:hypothetical protein [Phycisphaerales bacterium]
MITIEDIGKTPSEEGGAKQGERSVHQKWAEANISKKASGSEAKIVKKQVSKI